jgi:energy-coupling factor transport system substrate-specific component
MTVFAMLGTLMFCSNIFMDILPNIHLLGMFTITYTVVFRTKALIPIYIYILLNGLYAGFALWWVPYLYIWTILWGITMLFPQNMPIKVKCVVYPILCCLHGFAFGILYAPAYMLMYGLTFEQALTWVAVGAPFDVIHGIGNVFAGLLVVPLSELLMKLTKKRYRL